jgi:hypothetical protein
MTASYAETDRWASSIIPTMPSGLRRVGQISEKSRITYTALESEASFFHFMKELPISEPGRL